ncbi:hypothetical protein GCM10023114_58210 [Mycolicibacterium sediminis]
MFAEVQATNYGFAVARRWPHSHSGDRNMIQKLIVASLLIGAAAVGIAPVASAERPYKNCTEAHDDGAYDIPESSDAYWDGGDRDGDGIACES